MAVSVTHQLAQLNEARRIVLGDAQLYPQIVEGILPIISANARLELRRWGADFLAETFASPVVPTQSKEAMGIRVLQLLKDLLELPQPDIEVLKSAIQAAASIYGLVFRYIIANPRDSSTWNLMASIKSNVLNRWETSAPGVRICCIKFVQRVVQVQTPGAFDPRRPEKNEISLALVPRDHPLIPPSKLEPQASGLLDRLLNVFHEEPRHTMYISATLNCLVVLLRTRPFTYNKILNAVLNFSPFQLANGTVNGAGRLQVKSLEKTVRIFLLSILKRHEDGPTIGRIRSYLERLERNRLEIFAAETASRKRGLAAEPADGLDNSKRRRLGAELPKQYEPGPLPPGPNSYAQLYTLTDDSSLANFGVWQIPQDLVTRATLAILAHIEAQSLDRAINHVRTRYLTLSKEANQGKSAQGATEDDEEDYEPDFEPSEDREQILGKADAISEDAVTNEVALGPFSFPQPPPLSTKEAERLGQGTIDRVFGMMSVLDDSPAAKKQRPGLNRLAGSNYDRDAWLTIITRLATRSKVEIEDVHSEESTSKNLVRQSRNASKLSDGIRETLWRFVLEDFRARIGVAISWLNEEWFNDSIEARSRKAEQPESEDQPPIETPNYDKWTLKVLDGIMPYLDAKDKLLLRFLSEIPVVNDHVLDRVKSLAKDPERVDLAVRAIQYLILLKPPSREICIDAIEDLWRNYDEAKVSTTKILMKWRPYVLPPAPPKPTAAHPTNGSQSPANSKGSPGAGTPRSETTEGNQIKNPQASLPVAAVV